MAKPKLPFVGLTPFGQDFARSWDTVSRTPLFFVRNALLRIESEFLIGAQGGRPEQRGEGQSGMVTFRLLETQELLYMAMDYLRSEGLPVAIMTYKARQGGVSAAVKAMMIDAMLRNPHWAGGLVAQKVTSARDHMVWIQKTLDDLIEATGGLFFLDKDNVTEGVIRILGHPQGMEEANAIRAEMGLAPMRIGPSTITAVSATPEAVERLHGASASTFMLTEASLYGSAWKDVVNAIAAQAAYKPNAIMVAETIAQKGVTTGYDTSWWKSWVDQGEANFWEPTYLPRRAASLAIFFGYHVDPKNRGRLHRDVTWEQFEDSMNADDRRDYDTIFYPYHFFREERKNPGDERGNRARARIAALGNVAWRYGLLPSLYPRGLVVSPAVHYDDDVKLFTSNYPKTADDLRSAADDGMVFGLEARTWAAEEVERPFVFQGNIEWAEGQRQPTFQPGGALSVRVSKWPWEVPGRIGVFCDPNSGSISPGEEQGKDRQDWTFVVCFCMETGEEVMSFKTKYAAAHAVLVVAAMIRLCASRFVGREFSIDSPNLDLAEEMHEYVEYWEDVTSEPAGKIMQHLWARCGIPISVMGYGFDETAGKPLSVSRRYGINFARNKRLIVNAGVLSATSGALWAQGDRKGPRPSNTLVPRSPEIAAQMQWFIKTEDGEFSAQDKGSLGETRKFRNIIGNSSEDDALSVYCMASYVLERLILLGVDRLKPGAVSPSRSETMMQKMLRQMAHTKDSDGEAGSEWPDVSDYIPGSDFLSGDPTDGP